MIQYPKLKHATLGSADGYMTNLGIKKDPPRSVTLRKITKVDQHDILLHAAANQDRICENIRVYAVGVDPMNGASTLGMSNGIRGRSSRPVGKDGAFRPRILSAIEAAPLSRQPIASYNVQTNLFMDVNKPTNPDINKKAIHENKMHFSIQPTINTFFETGAQVMVNKKSIQENKKAFSIQSNPTTKFTKGAMPVNTAGSIRDSINHFSLHAGISKVMSTPQPTKNNHREVHEMINRFSVNSGISNVSSFTATPDAPVAHSIKDALHINQRINPTSTGTMFMDMSGQVKDSVAETMLRPHVPQTFSKRQGTFMDNAVDMGGQLRKTIQDKTHFSVTTNCYDKNLKYAELREATLKPTLSPESSITNVGYVPRFEAEKSLSFGTFNRRRRVR